MSINYIIQSDVVDITVDTPNDKDSFLVDTNVWYWMTYTKASTAPSYQLKDYPGYLQKALTTNSKIHHSGLSLPELAHQIEKNEREIYERTSGSIKPKEYRHNLSSERTRITSEIQTAWSQVSSLASPLNLTIDATITAVAIQRLQTEKVDGYDLFILESMKNHGVIQVITDDGDFATIQGNRVFTANRSVINAARKCGKLIKR